MFVILRVMLMASINSLVTWLQTRTNRLCLQCYVFVVTVLRHFSGTETQYLSVFIIVICCRNHIRATEVELATAVCPSAARPGHSFQHSHCTYENTLYYWCCMSFPRMCVMSKLVFNSWTVFTIVNESVLDKYTMSSVCLSVCKRNRSRASCSRN